MSCLSQNTKTSAFNYHLTPILFVHGSGLTSKTWQPIINYLIKKGYPPEYLYAVDLQPNDGANIRAAEQFIAPAVENLLEKVAISARQTNINIPERVDIIAHSMGAVSSRWYVAKLRPERVRIWISLAGANHGTNALCRYPSEGSKEMCPAFALSPTESAVQVALNGTPTQPLDETPYGLGRDRPEITSIPRDKNRHILYFTVRIEPDSWIKPENSAILDGTGGITLAIPSNLPVKETSPGNFRLEKPVGHDPLLQDQDLMSLLEIFLNISL